MFIEQPSIWLRWLYPKALWRMDRREKAVYLTFDDGPIPEATPFVLNVLKKYGVKATFFMVGDNVRKYPELYERVVAEGTASATTRTTISVVSATPSTITATTSRRPMPICTPTWCDRPTDGCVSASMRGCRGNTRLSCGTSSPATIPSG